MKTTGSVQEKNGRFYFVLNLYDANGKRKIKWISTGLTVRGNKRKAEAMLHEVLLRYDETGELPTGRGGAYEKVDTRTAKPIPAPVRPVSKSEMLFLDYLNEWIQIHKASIQTATFISYNQMIQGRITQYFKPLSLKLCEVTPQVLDEFQEKILLDGCTTNTVIHYHAIFGKAFKDAVRKDYLETNPMLKVDRPKKNSFRPNFYTKDEVQQLLDLVLGVEVGPEAVLLGPVYFQHRVGFQIILADGILERLAEDGVVVDNGVGGAAIQQDLFLKLVQHLRRDFTELQAQRLEVLRDAALNHLVVADEGGGLDGCLVNLNPLVEIIQKQHL